MRLVISITGRKSTKLVRFIKGRLCHQVRAFQHCLFRWSQGNSRRQST